MVQEGHDPAKTSTELGHVVVVFCHLEALHGGILPYVIGSVGRSLRPGPSEHQDVTSELI